jgi:hypothetical protein
MQTITPSVLHITCLSHLLNRTGDTMFGGIAAEFMGHWNMHMAHSHNAKALFRLITGMAYAVPGDTRWYSWLVSYEQVSGMVEGFVEVPSIVPDGPVRVVNQLAYFLEQREPSHPIREMARISTLKLFPFALTAMLVYGKVLERGCYRLEGDSPNLIFRAASIFRDVEAPFMATAILLPAVQAAFGLLPQGLQEEALKYVIDLKKRVRDYLASQRTSVPTTFAIIKAAEFFNPTVAKFKILNNQELGESLWPAALSKWFPDEVKAKLRAQAEAYKSACEQCTDPKMDITAWFQQQKKDPNCSFLAWIEMGENFALLSPSSASVERVWSIFSNFFATNSPTAGNIDYIQTVLMCQYNYRSQDGTAVAARQGEENDEDLPA